ncbi:MAG: mammalian cell entry protein [Mycobacterium sp.]
MEDQPADPGDLTTDAELPAQPAEAELPAQPAEAQSPEKSPRRRFSLRRRPKAAEPEAVFETPVESSEESEPTPRTPVGKSRRIPKADVPVAEEPVEPAEEPVEPAEDRILVPHRPASKRLLIAATAAGALFVVAAAFAGATVQPVLAERAAVDTKLDVARTAASAISTLWTYTPDNMEALPDRAEVFLGGDFANEYRKYIDAIVAPNKQAQVTNTTEVVGAAVESLSANEATALVYTNSVATSPVTKNIPSLRYLSYRLTMQRDHAKWLITKMDTVTSFDLTPQL